MKILHFADLHIGMENYGSIDPATGLHSRLVDFIASYNFLVDYAISHHIELVVFAGDAYKTREPSPTHENAFASGIKKLSNAGIPVVLVVGNHDLPNTRGKSDTLTIYDALDIPHVYVSSKPELLHITSATGAPVQIVTLPWVTKSHLLTKDEFAGRSIEEVNTALTGKLITIIEDFASQLDPAKPALFVSHVTVSGATYGSEQNVMLGSDVVIPLGTLANPKFNYVALGHLHKHQVLAENPPVMYAGSCDRVDFGEEKEPKGFVVASIAPGTPTTWEFVETPAREFMTVSVALSPTDPTPTETIISAIKKHDVTGKIVRLKIDVTQDVNRLINDKQIREALVGCHHFAGTQKVIDVSTRQRTAATSVSTDQTPLQALKTYLKAKDTDPVHAEKLESYALQMLKEMRE